MGDWIVRLIEQSGYLGIGFLMFLETMFPPIPSEVIMPVAGVAVGKGKLGLIGVIASGTAGAMLGNIIWYLAARALGHDRLRAVRAPLRQVDHGQLEATSSARTTGSTATASCSC